MKKQSGISLISLLIACAILVVLSTYIAFILFDLAQFDLRNRAQRATVSGGRFAMAKMRQDIRAANEITLPEPGSSVDQFTIQIKEETIRYYLNNDILMRENNGTEAITSNQVRVTNFQVTHIVDQNQNNLDSLKLELSIDWIGQLKPGQSPQYDLQSTISLRK